MQALFTQCYQPVTDSLWQRAGQVQLLICDVDGVFSDGRIYLGNQGEELKAFHTRDGFGVKALRKAGIEVAIITGRRSDIVRDRMQSLTVPYIYQGQEHKTPAFQELLEKTQLAPEQVAYIGDDLSDWEVMQKVGLSIAVADAHPYLRLQSQYVTQCPGGFGAVREAADLLLMSRDAFNQFQGSSS
ncbi:3-deoxy-manno-octulosonate-8-phosphatase KdsC [Alkalimonas delamerensis]|uniref:3-deoxy-D-manno-octulosonate 8-phosphate phosphatase KdsC n=1 Tax=Alkalimonas delamerensis TaxID=265981 RepID=A0ABT9GKH6_9GAMM|nr:3-deoxy-manno-octulosonate-8-phosphatase KdsC [Alkalimonas delamerensis]MDP4527473.1 3-deoxy-manno-octulosonate-8-phosphatase KdsC [Alkalimonas delamerensis]